MDKVTKILLTLLAVELSLVLLLDRGEGRRTRDRGQVTMDTVRVVVRDTVRVYQPVARDSVVVRYVTERLAVAEREESEGADAFVPLNDSVASSVDKIVGSVDSVAVEIPITQKMYEGEDWRAWVSGYRPMLDSLQVYRERQTITIVEREKPKRWSIGVVAGYGAILRGSVSFEPFVGIGVSYKLWSF